MKKFSVHKAGKYYSVKYHGYPNPSMMFDVRNPNHVYQSSRAEVEKYIEYVVETEKEVVKYLHSNELSYHPGMLVRRVLQFIDSLASGLDIRSGWSHEKMAQVIVDSYHRQVTEALEKCAEIKTRAFIEDGQTIFKDVDYEEYQSLRSKYELDIEDLSKYETSCGKALKDLVAATSEMLDKVKEIFGEEE